MTEWMLGCAAVALLACGGRDAPGLAARGEYLAKLMGCPACHSTDAARPYAGGLEGREAEGPWRAGNLTPHAATGIGSWTDAQIVAAIRDGVRPDGRALHPIMPYRYYRRLTDEDARAVVAFLRSLKPIEHAVEPLPPLLPPATAAAEPASDAPAEPRAPAAPQASAPAAPQASAPAASGAADRGEYLAAIMHCASCHATPGADGRPDPARPFAGGKAMRPFGAGLVSLGTGTLIASNLTPDRETGLGNWTAEDLGRAVRLLVRPDGTVIRGPMQLYAAGWAAIDDRDLAALAAFLKRLPPVRNPLPPSTYKRHE
jgi:cytochrome c553